MKLRIVYRNNNNEIVDVPKGYTPVDYAYRLAQLDCVEQVQLPKGLVFRTDDGTWLSSFTSREAHRLAPPKQRPTFKERWQYAKRLALEAFTPMELAVH